MKSFIQQTADYILDNFSETGARLCVLMPSRRATFVIREVLGTEKWDEEKRPKFYAIEDFIVAQSDLKKAEQVELLLELQEIFKKEVGLEQDNLMSWLPTLLRDFNRIDQNLVDAKQIFNNLADVGRMQQWNIEQNNMTETIAHYFKFWDDLLMVYQNFNKNLARKGKAYVGAMYRYLANHVQDKLVKHPVYEHFLFVGFNAMNKSEEKILRQLVKHNKATALWDSDDYYMADVTENQAGKFLKRYKNNISINPGKWLWQENLLLNTEKEIEIISTTNAVTQAKVAQELLREWGESAKDANTAIILPDENLLLPLMYSLDIPDVNITMGLSLQNSTLYNLVSAVFEMHQTSKLEMIEKETEDEHGKKETKQIQVERYYYKNIIKILNHPFIRKYEQLHKSTRKGVSFIRDAINHIVKRNIVFMSSGEIIRLPQYLLEFKEPDERDAYFFQYEHFQPLLKVLFQRWGDTNATQKAIKTLQDLTNFFSKFYQKSNQLERHYIRKFKEIVHDLKDTLKARAYNVDIRTLKIFIYQLIREERVAFDSERNSRIQIMGVLETRALDFDHVIILSTNEKTFPPAKRAGSLIPVDIAQAFELPTHADQDAIMSYHFYRLLQRTSKVALVHVSPSKTYGAAEKSRFVLQVENDLRKRSDGKIKIKQYAAFADKQIIKESPELEIPKSAEVLQIVMDNLEKGIAPTHIDIFLKCSLRYYFEQVAGIQEADAVEEDLGHDKFGTLLHEILEDLFRELAGEGNPVNIKVLEAEKSKIEERVKDKFQEIKYKGYSLVGNNYIAQQVIMKYLQDFLQAQIEELQDEIDGEVAYFEILGLEARRYNPSPIQNPQFLSIQPAHFKFDWKGKAVEVNVKGIIDRIDRIKSTLRIIDYKTGKVENKEVQIDPKELATHSSDKDLSKARQLWLYRYILLKNVLENPTFATYKDYMIEAGIYSMPKIKQKLMKLIPEENGKKGDAFPKNEYFVDKTEDILQKIFKRMLDDKEPFQKTDDLDTCEYCDYKRICGR